MRLSLGEAATVLGKSERQLRYLIKSGHLAASKEGGQWRVESTDLPLTEGQRRALAERLGTARAAFDKGTEAAAKAAGDDGARKQYSVTDLVAFQTGQVIFQDLRAALGEESPACRSLSAALTAVVCGFHEYQPAEKAKRFGEARQSAASAVAALLLQAERHQGLAERIEQELIPKISGLVASAERRSKRTRFESFGSSVFRSGPNR